MIKHCLNCTGPVCGSCGTIHDPAHEGMYGKAVQRLANAWHAAQHPYADEAKRHYYRERFKAANMSPERHPSWLSG
jgi:truncated hemoglobin YjbI